jgi:hypothetical protein
MKKLTLTSEGKTTDDLLLALQEITRLMRAGFTSGFDGNDNTNFTFQIKEIVCNQAK